MINGVHVIIFTPAADEVRSFIRDTFGFSNVDTGGGWLIFGLPPAELAVHSADEPRHEIYLMCDDLDATLLELAGKGVQLTRPISEQAWGRLTAITLPGGSELALYEPTHPRAIRDQDAGEPSSPTR